uniref:Uncharacterized protein n=1 Tax=Chinchilla lanigera TaxID=34839 RepID=A0A8C2YR47_CHILA
MAHGGPRGQLLGGDGKKVQPEALVWELSRCPALQRLSSPWYQRWLRTPPAIPSHPDVLQIHAHARGPSLILWPWLPDLGYVAYQDKKGSDFIQMLVEIVRANPGGDLLELLTEVNRGVCELDVLGPDKIRSWLLSHL